MARVIDYAAASARRRRNTDNVLADGIAEALTYFGGEAHRSMVLDRLVGARPAGEDPSHYRSALIEAFEAACDAGRFNKPFGRDSHRWALAGPVAKPSILSLQSARPAG